MFCDTHCHIYKEYYEDISRVLIDAYKNGISSFIVDGCDDSSNREVLELKEKYPHVFVTLGIHPESVSTYQEKDLRFIEEHIQDDKVVAIGEIGLDYHYDKSTREDQIVLLKKQLDLAKHYHKPVVIHMREATEDMISILKEYPDVRGVIHAFSGSLEIAKIFIKMGYKLGINGVITFKNCHLIDILPDIIHSIVLETDSPYLTPHPYRGTQNSPIHIKTIVNFICSQLKISSKELEEITNHNMKEIFKLSNNR